MNIEQLLAISPVIPVVTIRDPGHAVPLAESLRDAGIAIIEVTLRTPAALEAIERIAVGVKGVTVLAGTVCNGTQARESLAAGATALVSPGLTAALAEAVASTNAVWLPGVATASDILRGQEFGLAAFKLFPANIAGGPDALRAFAGPFPGIRFCPTGGIERDMAGRYLELANVACVGGSWVAPDRLINAADWGSIQENARSAANLRTATSS
jgi:Entner-Doudoroff aldolase